MLNNVTLVVPTTPLDVRSFLSNSKKFFQYLPIKRVCLICDTSKINNFSLDPNIILYEESELISYSAISNLLASRTNDKYVQKRTGWYLQQFLKMAFARVCEDDYYLLWDSDTIPLKLIDIFDKDGKPYLDYKTEYYKAYFDTLGKLLPGFKKMYHGSFIAEHMLVNTQHMCELLDVIEANETLSGNFFYEKIINAISLEELSQAGFSEFETYGTYVYKKYRGSYHLRRWYSFRFGGLFFINDDMKDNGLIEWMALHYHAITFEKNHSLSRARVVLLKKTIRKLFGPRILDWLSVPVRIYRRIF